MKEVSLRAALDERKASNPEPYQKLEELINLQRPDRYDQLTNTSLESYQQLHSAGFPSDSLVDQLTAEQIKHVMKVLKLDASRVFHQKDIDWIIHTYGLCFYATHHSRGKPWLRMEMDLKQFQQQILTQKEIQWHQSSYSVLGTSPALSGYPVPNPRVPLLLFNLGNDFHFLVSTYDSWIPAIRRLLYWPFASRRKGFIAYIVGFVSFFLLIAILPK
ncbi:MAG: hypothetical protein WBA23_02025, partial [Tunicatimonas sp.]|uniref:hypothetical protein n=1 Tax=Tunicatimonas sp. TaxID=1940096 RepID=UPI003C72B0D5